MKKLLLIAVVAGGLMVAGTTRSDAQVYFSIGFGPGYYGYYPYGSYYPYRYYARPYYRPYYAATVITAIVIGIPIVTGTSLTGIATPGWLDFKPA
jgi:hypothetical protein